MLSLLKANPIKSDATCLALFEICVESVSHVYTMQCKGDEHKKAQKANAKAKAMQRRKRALELKQMRRNVCTRHLQCATL